MTRVVVNETDRPTEQQVKTWGDLLERLDGEVSGRGHIVTATRFDGVDIPTFRDQRALSQSLADVVCVEIDTGPLTELLQRSLSEASGALETLCVAVRRIGGEFRGPDPAGASRDLRPLAESLTALVRMVDVASRALEINFDSMVVDDRSAAKLVLDTSECVGMVVSAQHAEDWIAVADGLEHDVAPALDRWRNFLVALRARAVVAGAA